MNENINIAKILKDAPKGTKLWSPICGECELCKEDLTCKTFPIVCIGIDDGLEWHFKADGSFTENTGVECLLFPSKDNRDWSTFKVSKEHKHFEPYQKVLCVINDFGHKIWAADFYSHYNEDKKQHNLVSGVVKDDTDNEVIPYEGNEDMVGKKAE